MREEIEKLVELIQEKAENLTATELSFVENMQEKLEGQEFSASERQLFWLRDIKDKLYGAR